MSETLISKVKDILTFFEEHYSAKIDDIFVEEYIKKDGSREYQNIEFFSKEFIYEATNFMITDAFSCYSLNNQIRIITIEKENYDFINATNESKCNIRITTYDNFSFTLKASKENCDYLKKIFDSYLKPNLRIKTIS